MEGPAWGHSRRTARLLGVLGCGDWVAAAQPGVRLPGGQAAVWRRPCRSPRRWPFLSLAHLQPGGLHAGMGAQS